MSSYKKSAAKKKKDKMSLLIEMAEKDNVLSLDVLRKRLDFEEQEQLEEFLIDAIRTKAIKAKIDELNGNLNVFSCPPKNFSRTEWELLSKKMVTLLGNLKFALDHIHDNNSAQHQEGLHAKEEEIPEED